MNSALLVKEIACFSVTVCVFYSTVLKLLKLKEPSYPFAKAFQSWAAEWRSQLCYHSVKLTETFGPTSTDIKSKLNGTVLRLIV